MKKKIKNNLFKLIIAVFIIIYLLFSSDAINELKGSIKEVSKNINIEEVNQNNFSDTLDVYFIDVGQADSILIKNEEHSMLIDAGNNEDGVKLVNYLNELNVNNFDYVIATHAHEDHIGGMDDIINNFQVDKFFMPDVLTTTKTFEDVLDALEDNDMTYNTFKENQEFSFGNANVKILYVGNDKNDLNDTSIVMKITYYNNSFLFTGDISSKVEKKILNKDLKSDVLKVAHHGSDYSSTDEFLDLVDPKYAVISVGKNNIYKHPAESTLLKLNDRNIKIYRTDTSGTIIMNSDGNNITIKTIKTDTNG